MNNCFTLALIVKNEEPRLPACLASVAGLADDVVVVDTGSSDRTHEVARQHGARVFDFPWCDDFSAARNECLRHAQGDWILWLDADERFDDANRERLRVLRATLGDDPAAYVFTQRSGSHTGNSTLRVQQVRLFRRHPAVRWEYRVHEQLLPSLRRAGVPVRWTDIVLEHDGYIDAALRGRKLERNLRLLQLDQADRPDDPFTLFNLGLAFTELNRLPEAVTLLRRSLERSGPGDSIVSKLYAALVRCHDRLGQRYEALATCQAGRARCPADAELLFLDGLLRRGQGDLAGAESCWRRLAQPLVPDVTDATPESVADAAFDLMPPGQFNDVDEGLPTLARQQWALLCRDQGRDDEAEELWRRSVAERPTFLPAWLGLGELYLTRQRWDAIEELATQLTALPGGAGEALVLRGRAALACRDFATARALLEQASAAAPHAVPPRLYLTHVLLQEHRDLTAAEQALRSLLTLDPTQTGAWRNLAVLLREQGRLAEAVTICQAAHTHAPNDPELLLLHGLLLHESGDVVNAEAVLLLLLERDGPAHPGIPTTEATRASERRVTARHNLGLLTRSQGRLTEAENHWRAALAERPDLVVAWAGLGEVCLAQNRSAEVEKMLVRLESLPQGIDLATLLRGRLLLQRRDFAAARHLLEETIARAPQAVEPKRLLSYVLLQEARDPAAAERCLNELLALAPNDVEARHNLALLRRTPNRAAG